MTHAPDLSDLVGEIYEAGLDAGRWPQVLERLTDLVGGQFGALAWPQGSRAGAILGVRMNPDRLRRYEHIWGRNLVVNALLPLPAGSVVTDRMLVPKAEFHRSEFYNDFLVPQGSETVIYVNCTPGGRSRCAIWRSPQQGEWEEAQIAQMRRLAPHLRRAMEINQRLNTSPSIQHAHRPNGALLAPRERECLARVAGGATSKTIATGLCLSRHTVDQYVESAMRKLGAGSRSEAVAKALALGLIRA
ncbi:regulatory protein, luxR family [Rhizobiales bacterium GAS188]|nr:regulatory protein, luxR family [Rhizobiales bacterium GAS188]